MRASGLNRAMDRTVNPVPEMARMVEMPSSLEARQAAMVMASVTEAASPVVSSVILRSASRLAQPP